METARRRRKTSNEMNDSRSVTARGPNGRAEFKRIAHVGQETDAPYTNACNASSNEKEIGVAQCTVHQGRDRS